MILGFLEEQNDYGFLQIDVLCSFKGFFDISPISSSFGSSSLFTSNTIPLAALSGLVKLLFEPTALL
jgi:hypothetical protein